MLPVRNQPLVTRRLDPPHVQPARVLSASCEQTVHPGLFPPQRSGLWLLEWATMLVYVYLAFIGRLQFSIWASVNEFCREDPWVYLFDKSWDELLNTPWGIRTGLVIPSLLTAEWLPVSAEQAFAVSTALTVIVTVVIINRVATRVFGTNPTFHNLFTLIAFIAISTFMNGRICYAFMGVAVMMRAQLYWLRGASSTQRTVLGNFAGLLFVTTSSGAFYVGCAMVLIWLWLAIMNCQWGQFRVRFRWDVCLYMAPILAFMVHESVIFAEKLLEWANGDVIHLLYHGPGIFLKRYTGLVDSTLFWVCTVFALNFAMVAWLTFVRVSNPIRVYLWNAVVVSLVAGMCGYSTLATNFPLLSVFVLNLLLGAGTLPRTSHFIIPTVARTPRQVSLR